MRETRKTGPHQKVSSISVSHPLSRESFSSLVLPRRDSSCTIENSPATNEHPPLREPEFRIERRIAALTLKNIVTQVGYIAGLGGIITTAWPYAIENLSSPVTCLCAILSVASFSSQWRKSALYRRQLNSLPSIPELETLRVRAQTIVDKLSPHLGLTDMRVIVVEKDLLFAGLVSGIVRPSIVVVAPSCQEFDDAEFTAVLAHELAHSNRPYALFRRYNSLLENLALPVTFASVFGSIAPYALDFFSNTLGFWGPAVGYFTAFVTTSVLHACLISYLEKLSQYMSHNNELVTDLRAIRITKDPDAFIKALHTTWEHMLPYTDTSYACDSQVHPSFARREQNVGELFGMTAKLDSSST